MIDQMWNPHRTLQAEDRVFRIGQTKDVTIYSLITNSPVDTFKQNNREVQHKQRITENSKDKITAADWLFHPEKDGEYTFKKLLAQERKYSEERTSLRFKFATETESLYKKIHKVSEVLE
jgi:hypothetical protein